MEKKSTIHPILTPLKSFYESLSEHEQKAYNSLDLEVLAEETKRLEVLSHLPRVKRNPTSSSINLILKYSKQYSQEKPAVNI